MEVLDNWKNKIGKFLNKRNHQIQNNIQQYNSDTSQHINNSISNLSSYTSNSLNNYVLNNEGTINTLNITGQIQNRNTSPNSETQTNYIKCIDKNNQYFGAIRFVNRINGSRCVKMDVDLTRQIYPNSMAMLQVGITSDGKEYTYTPTPTSSSNDYNIANTKWCHNASQLKNNGIVLKSSWNIGNAYCYQFTSGLLIQGGIIVATNEGINTITFHKSFTNSGLYSMSITTGDSIINDNQIAKCHKRNTTYLQFVGSSAQAYSWIAIGE